MGFSSFPQRKSSSNGATSEPISEAKTRVIDLLNEEADQRDLFCLLQEPLFSLGMAIG